MVLAQKEKLAVEGAIWLSHKNREEIKATKSRSFSSYVLMLKDGTVYQEKEADFAFKDKADCELQLELFVLLTEKGFFPESSQWYGYRNNDGEYCVAGRMPFLGDENEDDKPYIRESTGDANMEGYVEPLKRIFPNFDLNTHEGHLDFEALVGIDAWRKDNWKNVGCKNYLVDIEGVVSVKDYGRKHVQEVIRRIRYPLEPQHYSAFENLNLE